MNRAGSDSLVVFGIDERKFALPIPVVERVVRAVEITPLPDAPPSVRGVIDLRGRIVPVFDLRVRCGLPPRDVRPEDFFIIARTNRQPVALWVEFLVEVVSGSAAAEPVPDSELAVGALKLPGGIVLIQDIERFLSADETEALAAALGAA